MSPKNKIKLNLLRKELDKIDDFLLKIIQKRTKIVKKVLTLKSYKKEIIDKKRISSILNKIKKESVKRNIDPKITQRIWKNMIWSYINYEKKNFRKKLDKIDNNLLKIIHKRTKIVKKVLTLKSYKKEIIDKKRIASILNKIKKESLKKNIDPKITQRIWKNMIWSYIDFEKKNFRKK